MRRKGIRRPNGLTIARSPVERNRGREADPGEPGILFAAREIDLEESVLKTQALGARLSHSDGVKGRGPVRRLRRVWLGGLVALLLLAAVPASADTEAPAPSHDGAAKMMDMDLEDLMEVTVYAASRREQTSNEAPASVTVVTADEIRRHGWRTLAELLGSVRSFFVINDRTYNYFGVRGFAPPGDQDTKVLLLVDGHRVNDDIYHQAYVGEDFLVDLDLVDRVEVVRGPSSSLYGSNAFFAVVNVVTRRGRDLQGIEASGEIGTGRAGRGRLSYGREFSNGAELLLWGSLFDRQGGDLYFPEFDDSTTNHGLAHELDGEQSRRFHGSFSKGGMAITSAYVFRRKHIPTSSFGAVFPDPTNRADDVTWFAEARWQRTVGNVGVMLRGFYDAYRYDAQGTVEDSSVQPQPPFHYLLLDMARDEGLGGEVKLNHTLAGRHELTAGLEYKDVFRLRQHTYSEDPPTSALDAERPYSFYGTYAQDEFRLAKGLILNAGLRYDHYTTFGGSTNPRLALILSPREATALKFLYGEAFRAPGAYEMFWNDGGVSQKENPDLQAEQIATWETVWEERLGTHLKSTAAGYYYGIDNLITSVSDPVDSLTVFRNLGGVRGMGLELELQARWASGIDSRVSYTWQRTEDEDSGARLPNSPEHLAKAHLSAPLAWGGLFVAIEGLYQSRREPARPDHTTPVGGYTLANATLTGGEWVKGLELSFSIYNLFNTKYADLGGAEHVQETIPRDGRSARLKATYTL